MAIMEEIYMAYLEGKLCVKASEMSAGEYAKISDIEKRLKLSDSQCMDFERFLFEINDYYERSGFYSGFKIGVSLIGELACGRSTLKENK